MMAAVDPKLFRELKGRYPEVPDSVVTSCITQFGNDRDKCMEILTNESPKYLFGNTQNCHVNDHLARLNDMTIDETRPRSDSSGSNMSNTSSGSASSRPPYHTSHSLVNVPGYRGPIMPSGHDDNHPPTAPIISGDVNEFNKFINCYERNSQSIPNIDCRTYDRQVNYGMNYGHPGNSPSINYPHAQTNLRPIEVQHIQTNKDQIENNGSGLKPGAYTYQITVDPSLRQPGASSHMLSNNQSHSTANRSGGWVVHPVQNTSYQNVTCPNNLTTAFSSDLRSQQPVSQPQYLPPSSLSQYQSPTEEHRSFGAPPYSQNPFGSQHSTQTTIYLHNPVSPNPQNNTPRVDRTVQSPVPGQFIHSDPRMSPNYVRNSSMMGQPQQTIPNNPQNVAGRPVIFEIKTGGRGDNTGVQSQIKFFDKIAGGAVSSSGQVGGSGQQTIGQGSVIGQPPQHDIYVPDSSQLSYEGHYTAERPSVINVQGASTSQGEAGFLQFPPMPNVCRVPGHPHGPPHTVQSASTDSEPAYKSELDYRQIPSRPFVSPASSHSSLSSESSPAVRPRSNSLQDDPAYLQALLSHQKSRMEKLTEDLSVAEGRVTQLKGEVTELERSVIERKRKRKSTFPSVDLAKLRGDNIQLQADIQLMTREIDLFNNGQTPLGVLDPIEQQHFYKNMNTGQRGSIYGNTTQTPPRTFTSTVTTAVATSSSTPTRPPPEIPPTLPPRDNLTRDVPPPLPPRITSSQVPPPPPHQPAVGSGDSDVDGEQWSCSACTFLNHPALNKCECCEMPRMNVATSPPQPASPGDTPDTYPTPVQTAQST